MAAQNLDLIWNEILSQSGDSLQLYITRSFNLSITFSPSDIVRIYGKANFFLTRNDTNSIWKLSLWKDDSAY